MRILITGATGCLGRATVRELVRSGHARRAIVRDASRPAGSWPSAGVDVDCARLGPPPESGRLDFLLDSAQSVDTTRSTAELGLTYRSLGDTLSDTIRWWAANGVIDAGLACRLATAAPAHGAA
jgi:nucleoside-diphosphate-sugar epimerase